MLEDKCVDISFVMIPVADAVIIHFQYLLDDDDLRALGCDIRIEECRYEKLEAQGCRAEGIGIPAIPVIPLRMVKLLRSCVRQTDVHQVTRIAAAKGPEPLDVVRFQVLCSDQAGAGLHHVSV